MRKPLTFVAALLASSTLASVAAAAPSVVVVSGNHKIRPADGLPQGDDHATIKAAKNEFEPFQIVVADPNGLSGVSAKIGQTLTGPNGATIADDNVVFYREGYYDVGTPSNSEGASGPWPDPLIPTVDTYFGETRNGFPFDVPSGGTTRVIWVDVFVPQDATAGDYTGQIQLSDANGTSFAPIPVYLHVGTFSLPSTATLQSAFGMGWADPCIAHTGNNGCDPVSGWNEEKADELRALYVRAGLEHRFTISDVEYQPPFGGSSGPFSSNLLPYVTGTGKSRLPGAQVTTFNSDGNDAASILSYAQQNGFYDRVFFYPTDEPGSNQGKWDSFISAAQSLHSADSNGRIIITSSIQDADAAGATDSIDIFVPVIDQLENRPGTTYDGNQRPKYDAWLSAKPNRSIWGYQSCDSHGCGACGDPSPDPAFTGWPSRVIDSSAVQDRCFPWLAFQLDLSGELYFDVTYQLASAWDSNGQCAFSGSGDGTVFYPGTPDRIGGTHDIPVESIRMKLIREGMEDYEYLALLAKADAAKAHALADALFPHAYECNQSPASLEGARDALFALLDEPADVGAGGGPSGSGGATGSAGEQGSAGTTSSSGGTSSGSAGSTPSGGATSGKAGSTASGGATSGKGGATSTGGASGKGGTSSFGGAHAASAGASTSKAGAGGASNGQAGMTIVKYPNDPADDSSSAGGCGVSLEKPRSGLGFALVLGLAALLRTRRRGDGNGLRTEKR